MADGTFDRLRMRTEVRKKRRDAPLYWSRIADIARKRPERLPLAQHAAERARSIAPNSSTNTAVYLKIAFSRGAYSDVYDEASKAVVRWPKIFSLWRHLANAAMELGMPVEALRAAQGGFGVSKKPDAYGLMVRALQNAGMEAELRDIFGEAIGKYPNDPWLKRQKNIIIAMEK